MHQITYTTEINEINDQYLLFLCSYNAFGNHAEILSPT